MLIEKIQQTNNHDEWIRYIEDRPFNDKRYYISNQKVKNLGWTIETDFDNGLNELIEKMRTK
jgi:dTDP-D-glucose 4,6-dehydratase